MAQDLTESIRIAAAIVALKDGTCYKFSSKDSVSYS